MLAIPGIKLARGIAIARARDRNLSPAAMALIDVIKSKLGDVDMKQHHSG